MNDLKRRVRKLIAESLATLAAYKKAQAAERAKSDGRLAHSGPGT